MDAIARLSAKLDQLIEFGRGHALLGAGRNHNPLYDPEAATLKGPHRMGQGRLQSVPLSRVISPQATIHGGKVRSIKDKTLRGTLRPRKVPPVLQKVGSHFIVHDGNHFLAGALRAGKRSVKALVQ